MLLMEKTKEYIIEQLVSEAVAGPTQSWVAKATLLSDEYWHRYDEFFEEETGIPRDRWVPLMRKGALKSFSQALEKSARITGHERHAGFWTDKFNNHIPRLIGSGCFLYRTDTARPFILVDEDFCYELLWQARDLVRTATEIIETGEELFDALTKALKSVSTAKQLVEELPEASRFLAPHLIPEEGDEFPEESIAQTLSTLRNKLSSLSEEQSNGDRT